VTDTCVFIRFGLWSLRSSRTRTGTVSPVEASDVCTPFSPLHSRNRSSCGGSPTTWWPNRHSPSAHGQNNVWTILERQLHALW